jgi:hypothetical protein
MQNDFVRKKAKQRWGGGLAQRRVIMQMRLFHACMISGLDVPLMNTATGRVLSL